MFIMHIALQGCLRAHDIEYGITADTGGHIRYLMQLAAASARDPRIERIDIVTRAFDTDFSAADYRRPCEYLNPKTRIVRLPTSDPGYLCKEQLSTQLPVFIQALNAYIGALSRRPDFLHAHYADAAEVARGVRACHGIDFVFTAHSLGRIKKVFTAGRAKSAQIETVEDAALERRIEYEESALADAVLVLASSRDEAEVQYAGYRHYDAGRIRVLAPGIDPEPFRRAESSTHVQTLLSRFLRDPDKPALLAIARPVTRKNLAALVRAYGESTVLQARANLVIVAGCRDDIGRLEPELATNMNELLALIDRYDLYGRVAYPKAHRDADIAAFYAWVRERRGVFVNPALNEPFGLTLLEAAAAGVPVVATDSGGPNDILQRCGNGMLVDPYNPAAIAAGALTLIDDASRWQRCADNGRRAIAAYDWREHAAHYHRLLDDLRKRPAHSPRGGPATLLVCDIDGTLVGGDDGIDYFNRWYEHERDLLLGIATGRSFHSALAVLEQFGVVRPRVLITSVGSEIYHLTEDGTTYRRDRDWQRRIERDWSRDAVRTALVGFPGLQPQAPLEQRDYKLSYCVENDPDMAARVRAHLADQGLKCAVIYSHDRYLDVLPWGAAKGMAVEHVRALYGVAAERVMVAGDSGNDLDMLSRASCAVVVGNCRDGLAEATELDHAYKARARHARGIIEGVRYFRVRMRSAS